MRKKKFRPMIDHISFADFVEIHFDKAKFLSKDFAKEPEIDPFKSNTSKFNSPNRKKKQSSTHNALS